MLVLQARSATPTRSAHVALEKSVVWIVSVALAFFALLWAPRDAEAKTKVEIGAVEWKPHEEVTKEREKQVRTKVRRLAAASAKHLDFGKKGKVEVSFVVKELTVTTEGDVIRVTCTLLGKLKGGGSARSRLSFGGKPDARKKLEREVLTAVTDGVMTRLAEIAREREKAAEKKAD
ncbi:MAG: hypothetical protein U0271_20035 [Polyangiaceae bacterium]